MTKGVKRMKNLLIFFKQRSKNYGFWVSFLALIPMACQLAGFELPTGEFESMTNAILTFLVAAGLVSNPTTESRWYADDKCQCSSERY